MKFYLLILMSLTLLSGSVFSQGTIVLNDPAAKTKKETNLAPVEKLLGKSVLPKIRKVWAEDVCSDGFQITGTANGAFTRRGAVQTIVFFEYCQTGNGFGNNGAAIIENRRIVSAYSSEGGWPVEVKAAPDINKNGLDEVLFYYSGGMHQGVGGTGAEIVEFGAGKSICMGWFLADRFGEESGDFGWKVTVKPAKRPVFYRRKYLDSNGKWQPKGKIAAFSLEKKCFTYKLLK
jgi:hypothetical protein